MSYTQNGRIFRIFELIQSHSGLSAQDIIDKLIEDDYRLSKRTLERDLARFRDLYKIEIQYHKGDNKYYLIDQNESRLNAFSRIKAHRIQSELLDISNQNEYQDYIEFEKNLAGPDTGVFRKIIGAIHKHKMLRITYRKYGASERIHLVQPRLLKEYQHRWYLITTQVGKVTPIVFSLDQNRLRGVEVLSEVFKPEIKLNEIKERFQAIIGVYYPDDTEQEILLEMTETEAGYLESQPWHVSQKFVKQEGNRFYFSFYLVPNIELVKKILSSSPAIRVVKPNALCTWIEEILEDALDLYQGE